MPPSAAMCFGRMIGPESGADAEYRVMAGPVPFFVRAVGVLVVVGIVAYAVHAVTRFGGADADIFFMSYAYQAIKSGALALILARVVLVREQRLAFGLLALGSLLNLGGDIAWSALYRDAESLVPVPSIADVFYVSAYAPFGAAVALLISGTRTRTVGSGLWLDGLVVALTLGTVMAYVVLPPMLAAWQDTDLAAILTNAAYPVGDALLLTALVSSLALRNWRLDHRCALLALAFGTFVAADAVYLIQLAEGTYVTAGVLDLGWLVASAMAGASAWVCKPPASPEITAARLSAMVPSIAGAVALGLLVLDRPGPDTEWLLAPVVTIALLIFIRFSLVSHDNHRLIDHNRLEAVTDPLTGLANRRRLLEDLAVSHDRDRVVILFDLDGFKLYNDHYGHPAGDSLLQMIGADLRAAVANGGTAYRLGGDEFCAVLATDADPGVLGARLAAAMGRMGHGFNVGASFGTAVVPAGSPAPPRTLNVADERLYASKHRRRVSAESQSAEVLLALVGERTPELSSHRSSVARLGAEVANRLGMSQAEAQIVRHAGALHDIGKMAIPDEILRKSGPLTEDEWSLMRQHTVIGDRILSAAPALRRVAQIVRASHERWDGAGYPDGIAGSDIPLGARIIFACDAYDAMTTNLPYSRQRSSEAALAELERCAGTQFDPAVVAALADHLREPDPSPVEPAARDLVAVAQVVSTNVLP